MRITLIKPNMLTVRGGDSLEPLVFGILAALTPRDIELRFYDERIEPIPFDEPTDLVAISCDTYSARRSYQITARYHSRNIPVVLGGCHPTLCPDEALQYAPTIVIGDAEDTWPQVVADARAGNLERVYKSSLPGLAGLRFDRSIFKGRRYGPMRLVQLGRGCCHGCDFCSVHSLYGNLIRHRPVDEVVREIEQLGSKPVIFTDDNFFVNRAAAIDLLERIKPLRIRWACQAMTDVADDDDLLNLMAASGCLSVTVGLESLSDGNLAQMNKGRRQTSRHYERCVRRFHDRGIMVYGSFIFGYDHDTALDFRPTLEFSLALKLLLANFNPLIPMPGTALYERLHVEGRLLHDPWWLNPNYRYGAAPFVPRNMSPDELTDGIYWIRTEFNRYRSIITRATNMKANARSLFHAGAYLACNLINRREIHRKQGLPLGEPGPIEPILSGCASR